MPDGDFVQPVTVRERMVDLAVRRQWMLFGDAETDRRVMLADLFPLATMDVRLFERAVSPTFIASVCREFALIRASTHAPAPLG